MMIFYPSKYLINSSLPPLKETTARKKKKKITIVKNEVIVDL
jgi:hypothetical protein